MDTWHQLSSAENEGKQMFDVKGEFFAVLPLLIALPSPFDRIWRQMQLFFCSTFFVLCIARKLHENYGDK